MVIFATAWGSVEKLHYGNVLIRVSSFVDVIVLLVGTATTCGLLYVISKYIPAEMAAIRLALLSTLLYAAIFLTYGWGYGLASHAVLWGVLIYTMVFESRHLEETGRRVAIYDFDSTVADRMTDITGKQQELEIARDATAVEKRAHVVRLAESKLRLDQASLDGEARLTEHLAQINARKIDISSAMNMRQLEFIERKFSLLEQGLDIVSSELSRRIDEDTSNRLAQIAESARTMGPGEFAREYIQMIEHLNSILGDVPESISELRRQLTSAAKELEENTRTLIADSRSAQNTESVDSPKRPESSIPAGNNVKSNTEDLDSGSISDHPNDIT
jgi:hypothetical protein